MSMLQALFARNEFLAGLFVVVLGGICLAAVGDLEIGTATEMGPGYVPRALAWFLVIAGVGMAVTGARRSLPVRATIGWRPLVLVSAAVMLFGATVDRFGIVVAVLLSTVVASLASSISRRHETPLVAIGLAAFAALAFVKGLGLAIPIWPR